MSKNGTGWAVRPCSVNGLQVRSRPYKADQNLLTFSHVHAPGDALPGLVDTFC